MNLRITSTPLIAILLITSPLHGASIKAYQTPLKKWRVLFETPLTRSLAFFTPKTSSSSPPSPSPEDNKTLDLFKKAFGSTKKARKHQFLAPFFLNGVQVAKVLVWIQDQEVLFQARYPLQKMQALLDPKVEEKLRSQVDKEGFISMSTLKTIGMLAHYDGKKLFLSVEIPADLRRQQQLSIRKVKQSPIESSALIPEDLSSFLNYYLRKDYEKTPSLTHWTPFQGRFESLFNVKNWVIENNFSYTDRKQAVKWKRSMQRVSYDFPHQMLRFTAGDFNFATTNFRNLSGFGGLGIKKAYETQPQFDKAAQIQKDFFLENPSSLEIYVNGSRSKRIQLEPGLHTLSEFTKESGYNEGKVRIQDSFGKVEWVHFSFHYDPKLLKPHAHEFTYNLLYPRTTQKGHIHYDPTLPGIDIEHYYGFSESHTAGLYVQKNHQQSLYGFQNLSTWFKGRLTLDTALSQSKFLPSSYAFHAKYNLYPQNHSNNPYRLSSSFSLTHKGKNFAPFGNARASNPLSWLFTSSFNKALEKNLQAHASLSVEWARENKKKGWFFNLGFDRTWSSYFDSSLQFQFLKDIKGKRDIGMIFTLNANLSKGESQLSYSYNTLANESDYNFTTNYSQMPRVENIDLSYQSNPENHNAYLLYNRGNELFTGGIGLDRSETRNLAYVSSKVQLNLASSLVYAGKQFAVSKPISNSFAIFSPHPTIKPWGLFLNPTSNEYLSKSHPFTPAVITNLSSYTPSTFYVASPKLPQGYSLGKTRYQLLPKHRSGFHVTVGEASTIMLQSTLVDPLGKPLSLLAGRIIPKHSKKTPLTFFTNKKGRVRVLGLSPGHYVLKVFSPQYESIELYFEKDQHGLVILPQIILPLKETPP